MNVKGRCFSPRPMDYLSAVQDIRALEILRDFDPRIVGTPPLGLALPGSDIDIICEMKDDIAYREILNSAFGHFDAFELRTSRLRPEAIIANFNAHGWPFEIFGAPQPVEQQAGWIHFQVERRLLAYGGDGFRQRILAERRLGRKTEPAFANILELTGDPYAAMLELNQRSDRELQLLVRAALNRRRG